MQIVTNKNLNSTMRKVNEKLVIAVTGCTGTGKTKLGIELAKRYNGEVVSADSMQIYKGLDVITNKVTTKEAEGVVHHCVDYVPADEQYTVNKYLQHTLPIIEDIIKRGKHPIIVGGTAYYIEALLWNFTLSSSECAKEDISDTNLQILNCSKLNDYEKLQQIDPQTAIRLHPSDSRKIERSLDIYRQSGTCQSKLLEEQHDGSDNIRGKLRWDRALLFSMECCQETLDKRLDDRVDKMVELGLCHELLEASNSGDCSGLLMQAIGYKEFEKYISLKQNGCVESDDLSNALSEGLEKMKTTTRRYSRKQLRWIKHRLAQDMENYHFNRLDTTFPEKWALDISEPAFAITDKFLSGKLETNCETSKRPVKVSQICEVCDVTCIGDVSFTAHMTSKKHKKRKAYLKQKPLYEKCISDKNILS